MTSFLATVFVIFILLMLPVVFAVFVAWMISMAFRRR